MSKKNENKMTIGKKLADARVKKGYTIDDLQKITKIQKKYLIAIETNHFEQLPGDFYVRAFVKQYADSVGLNGRELLNDYDDNLPNTKSNDYVDKVSEDKLATRTAQHKTNERFTTVKKYVPIVSTIIIVLLIIIVIWIAAAKSSHSTSQVHINSNNSVSVSNSKVSSESKSSTLKKSSKSIKKSHKKIKNDVKTKITKESDTSFNVSSNVKHNQIKISSGDRDWISVSADGKSLWQSAQEAGSSHTVRLPSNVKTASINLGNALKANIKINGKKLSINPSTQVQQITLKF